MLLHFIFSWYRFSHQLFNKMPVFFELRSSDYISHVILQQVIENGDWFQQPIQLWNFPNKISTAKRFTKNIIHVWYNCTETCISHKAINYTRVAKKKKSIKATQIVNKKYHFKPAWNTSNFHTISISFQWILFTRDN